MSPFGIIMVQLALGTIFFTLANNDDLKELSSYNNWCSAKCKKLHDKNATFLPDVYIETKATLDCLSDAMKLTDEIVEQNPLFDDKKVQQMVNSGMVCDSPIQQSKTEASTEVSVKGAASSGVQLSFAMFVSAPTLVVIYTLRLI